MCSPTLIRLEKIGGASGWLPTPPAHSVTRAGKLKRKVIIAIEVNACNIGFAGIILCLRIFSSQDG